MEFNHIPVMANEIVDIAISTPAVGTMIDATLGGAGHSKLLLENRPNDNLIAFDRDPDAIAVASNRLSSFKERVEIIHSGFDQISKEINLRNKKGEVSIVLFDLGVSSYQLDTKQRGFTYRHHDAPLDMRMDSSQELTAKEIVNNYSYEELEEVLRKYSDERFSREIAKEIVASRPIETSGELVETIRKAIPHRFQRLTHPAKRTFQALRMEVNKELDQLQSALDETVHLLAPGGRILVLSYHSGEDKLVKNIFSKYIEKDIQTKDGRLIPQVQKTVTPTATLKTVHAPKKPSKGEIKSNPRAKSARLRVVEKIDDSNFSDVVGM